MVRGLRFWLVLAAILAGPAASARPQPPAAHPPATIPGPELDDDDVLAVQGATLPAGVTPLSYDITVAPDAQALKTRGEETIDIDVRQPTATVTLNALHIDLAKASVDGAPAAIATDDTAQTATFTFAQAIRPGRHRLDIDFTSPIARHAYGLFAVDYRNPDGTSDRLLATQFESTAAHRFIPCWDDPADKAVFTLHVTAPADRMVVSNTPIARSTPEAGGLQAVDFKPTPKMSPYLLFLSIGHYERIHRQVEGVDIGVITTKGKGDQGRYALDAAADILRYYDTYFGIRYPLPKMDMIAAPIITDGFAAMENWGALLYLERAILVSPQSPNLDERRQYVFNVVAHEMAHQWFGDLVTMRDWDELWLNEGFANWMAAKTADALHPDWQAQAQELSGRESAMAVDARADAPPIVHQPGMPELKETPEAITYGKGEYLVRMVEAYLGPGTFRDGIRRYLRAHAYGNTTSDDLWAALKAASHIDIAPIAHGFTDQPGIPLIQVATTPEGLQLTQARFGMTEQARATIVWQAPTPFAPPGGKPSWRIVSAGAPVTLPASLTAPLVVNAGQTSYQRVDYDAASLAALTRAFGRLPAIDQVGVLDDQWALAAGGYHPLGQWLSLLRHIPPDADPIVWSLAIERLAAIDTFYGDGDQRAAYHAAVNALLAPVSKGARGDGPNSATLRRHFDLLDARFSSPHRAITPRPRPPYDQLGEVDAWAAGR